MDKFIADQWVFFAAAGVGLLVFEVVRQRRATADKAAKGAKKAPVKMPEPPP
eukprot:gene10764-9437_t